MNTSDDCPIWKWYQIVNWNILYVDNMLWSQVLLEDTITELQSSYALFYDIYYTRVEIVLMLTIQQLWNSIMTRMIR